MTRPNILILISHDTGRYLSPYGINTVQTPHFKRLASQSLLFENTHCCAPQCSPARAALFSGQYPHTVGVMGNVGREHGWTFPREQRHAGRIFSEHGYTTWMLGLQHESYEPETLGFEQLDLGFPIAEAANHLSKHLDTLDDRPFYCQIGCKETHRPWGDPDDILGVTVPTYLNNGPATQADLAKLQGDVALLDTGLGQILDLLEERDMVNNTILVVTSDHGLPVPHAKGTLLDSGTGVYLFMRWPDGNWRTGREPALVSHVDLLPTLLQSIGEDPEPQMQGRSLLPLLQTGTSVQDAIYSEKTYFGIYDPMRSIRTDRWLYIKNFELCRWSEMPMDAWGSGSHQELGDRWQGGHPADELYDAVNDPDGEHNLARSPEHAEILGELKQRLGQWMQETQDPLLKGPVQSPYHRREVDSLFP